MNEAIPTCTATSGDLTSGHSRRSLPCGELLRLHDALFRLWPAIFAQMDRQLADASGMAVPGQAVPCVFDDFSRRCFDWVCRMQMEKVSSVVDITVMVFYWRI